MKRYSIVVLGAGGVGKTSLVRQFIHGFFPDSYLPTVEDCHRHSVRLPDGVFHTIEILDTAGHHQFPAMRELSIKMGQAFVVVYAINNRKTFDEATRMVEKIKEIKETSDIPMVLVGNKNDDEAHREVALEQANKLALEVDNCAVLETSAKSFVSVNKLFTDLLVKALGLGETLDGIKQRRASSFVKRRLSMSIKKKTLEKKNITQRSKSVCGTHHHTMSHVPVEIGQQKCVIL